MSKEQQAQVRGRSNKVMLISCGLALIAAAIIGVIINNATAGSRFESEIVAINDAFTNGKEQKINEVLDRTVSSGDYAKVEKSLKTYVGDIVKNINEIKAITDNEAIYDALDGIFLSKNMDKLDDVIVELKDATTKVEKLNDDYKRLYSEDGAKDYVKDQNLSENFSKLYIENAKMFYDDEDLRKDYDSVLNVMKASVKVEAEAVEYLKNHKSDWKISDGEVKFTNSKTEAEYTKILQKVAEYQK